MKVIVGLGNPGKKYANTRHNAGYAVIDVLSERFGVELIKAKHNGLTGEKVIDGEKLMLVKPMTFMNLSGECVASIKNFYKLSDEDIIVVYDDASIPAGSVRARENGADGGHNGMKSIISHLGSESFARVRVGIGAPPNGWDLADYVLAFIAEDDKGAFEEAVKNAAECVRLIINGEIKAAMNKYNRRVKHDESVGESQ